MTKIKEYLLEVSILLVIPLSIYANTNVAQGADKCSTLKTGVLSKQKVIASLVINANKAGSRAKSTYMPTDTRKYITAYTAYAKKTLETIRFAKSASEECFSYDKQAELISVEVTWSNLYDKYKSISALDIDPGLIKNINAPKFYEWLYN